ncbi:hypothetical protein EW026_g6117 [Hermanssonia centrifuga]|uniref:Small secreted protein n=1 Tax=Hermanssonia centrifuga TaxID=98765 RepID=A0A4S4KC23_9APHY|nr:hypothetical protein EW026_g6117 [Hermanssonia centrifuga]
MVRLTAALALIIPALISLTGAAPVPSVGSVVKRAAFELQDYADFQISDGKTGTAQAEAAAIFLDPFDGVDLATVDDDTQNAIQSMREAAEDAETDQFNPAIADASGAAATALQNGKIKNKVLKLTGEVQVLNIKIAKANASGDDTSDLEDQLSTETKKLNTNIATDVKNAGQVSKGVV